MVYFFSNLMVHLFISASLAIAVVFFHRANRRQTVKKGIFFLLPFFVSILFLLHVAFVSVPRMLDSVDVMRARYEKSEYVVEAVGPLNTLDLDGQTYYRNPFVPKPQVGDVLVVEHTVHARYVASMKKIGEA